MKKNMESEADLMIQNVERQQRLTQEADRPFTKMLFGLWLLSIFGLFIAGAALLGEDQSGHSQFLVGIMFWMVIITGAYTFQEVRRLHKRIDASRKLNEREHRTNN